MKATTVIKALVCALPLGLAVQSASALEFDFSNNGTVPGTITKVLEFDWGVGNVLAEDALVVPGGPVKPAGSTFFTYFQARLNGFQVAPGSNVNPGGGASGGVYLPIGQEITIVAGFKEEVTFVSGDFTQSSFKVVDDAMNFVKIYYDSTGDSNASTGAGFGDGLMIFSGKPVSGLSGVDVNDPDTNKGALNITALIDYVDTAFFPTLPADLLSLRLINPGTVQDLNSLPDGVDFDTKVGTTEFNAGTTDFGFRSDINSKIETVIPEPITAGLSLMGLSALGLAAARRRR
ncbi:MAG: hypothetical protein GC164_05970 [Phycisphaera sp.]|nr:hypothetical protein [Phycisphaera sp.]